ncbi:MAG: shikimate kinase [Candidatus Omnitrophica bacterium]|nr:shikimate kinase [Candidatus Omnitrophota bacterium]
MSKKNIALIGFMGSGKSVVSKKLAAILKREAISTDDWIERREGRSINRIFEESGEPYFREQETQAVREVAGKEPVVIDCGGGVVLNPQNIKELRKKSIIVFLAASPKTVYQRIKDKEDRPLLKTADPQTRIRQLMDQRQSFYAQADYTVVTDKKTVQQVCEEILHLLAHE